MVRIRKNSTLSPLLFCSYAPPNDDLRPRVCKLNQSPWDAIVPSLLDSSHKLEAEDGSYVNSNLGHSIVAKESVASPMEIEEKPDTAVVRGSVDSTDCNGYRRCQRNNGKGWRCNKEANEGVCLCEYHYKRRRRRNVNYCIDANENNNINTTTSNDTTNFLPLKKVIVPVKELATHRVRPKVVVKKGKTALKTPYEFYNYSGFGTRWGRNRGISKHKMETKVAAAENVATTPTSSCTTATQISNPESHSPHKIDNGDQVYYIEDDFDDDEDEDECGRKRMRRHVKSRSLKSLM